MKPSIALMLFLLAGCASATPATDPVPGVELNGHHFSTEFATDDASRAQGLMMRTTLAPDHSMLFAFPYSAPQAFWMKNTLIPLDILFFDAERKLVSVQPNVPPCKADPCPSYPSDAPARYVLELSAGTAKRIGAKVGDELTIEGDMGVVN